MKISRSTLAGVPERYATALFALALEENRLDEIARELDTIMKWLEDSGDLRRLVHDRAFSAAEQSRGLEAILEKAGLSSYVMNFVKLLCRNRRLFYFADMVGAYKALLAERRGDAVAEVTAAQELSQTQISRLKKVLKDHVGLSVSVKTHVNPTILGGLIVKLGSMMVDSSLDTKLKNLAIAMKEVG
ncbi:MAG: F0F1 ATP synthase subunit delta [Hyphomicrobiales bacterium]